MAQGLEYINRGKRNLMTNSTDPKTTNPGLNYQQVLTKPVSMQTVATAITLAIAVFGFQWQVSSLVSNVTVQLTKSDLQVQELKADITELKANIRELSLQIDSFKTRSPYRNNRAYENGSQ
jgi:hypothetical protein